VISLPIHPIHPIPSLSDAPLLVPHCTAPAPSYPSIHPSIHPSMPRLRVCDWASNPLEKRTHTPSVHAHAHLPAESELIPLIPIKPSHPPPTDAGRWLDTGACCSVKLRRDQRTNIHQQVVTRIPQATHPTFHTHEQPFIRIFYASPRFASPRLAPSRLTLYLLAPLHCTSYLP
jgi:hypothetical protein